MPAPPGSLRGWGSFGQASRPSQDLGYAPGSSSSTGPSFGPFIGDDDNNDDDIYQFIKGDDSL